MHQPAPKADASGRSRPRPCEPSIRQTAMVIGATIMATSEKGGNARAPIAPEANAIARRRHPDERMTRSATQATQFVGAAVAAAAVIEEALRVRLSNRLSMNLSHCGNPYDIPDARPLG